MAVEVTASSLSNAAMAQPRGPSQTVAPARVPAPSGGLDREEAIAARVKAQLSPELERVTRAAQLAQETANQQLGHIVNLMGVFLGVVGLGAALLTAAGLFEWRRLARLRRDAERHLTAMKGRAQQIEEDSMKMTVLRAATERAWAGIGRSFDDLPDLKISRIIGGSAAMLPPEISAVFEDADITLVVGHQLNVIEDSKRMSVSFYKLAAYWRYVGNYPRAIARAENAIKLDPESPEAFRQLSLVLRNCAAESPLATIQKADMLRRAELALWDVVKLQRHHDSKTLKELAWIDDERGQYQTAEDHYRDARDLDKLECEVEQREPNWDITYNLACTLAKAGKHELCITELSTVLDKDENWNGVLGEPPDRDLLGMLTHATWGPHLCALAQHARARAISSVSSSSGPSDAPGTSVTP